MADGNIPPGWLMVDGTKPNGWRMGEPPKLESTMPIRCWPQFPNTFPERHQVPDWLSSISSEPDFLQQRCDRCWKWNDISQNHLNISINFLIQMCSYIYIYIIYENDWKPHVFERAARPPIPFMIPICPSRFTTQFASEISQASSHRKLMITSAAHHRGSQRALGMVIHESLKWWWKPVFQVNCEISINL